MISFSFNIKNKGIGFYVGIAAVVLALLALILICVTGSSNSDLTGGMVVLLVLGVIFDAAELFIDFHSVPALAGLVLTGCGIMSIIDSRMNRIGLILNGVMVDTTGTFGGIFIVGVVCGILAMVCCCVVGFMGTEKKAKPQEA